MHLPIFAVTGRALWFVVRNLVTLIRLTWLPLVVLIATEWAIAYWYAWRLPPGTTIDMLADDLDLLLISLGAIALEGLALSVVAVRVHRMILFHDTRPGEYFAFPFGWTELLYVVMGTLSFVALLAGVIAIFALADVFGGLPEPGSKPFDDIVGSGKLPVLAVLIVGYIFVVWLSLRLMVWPPAVVANRRLSLGEALGLTRGKAWAMFGLSIVSSFAIFVPIGYLTYWSATSAVLAKIRTAQDFKAIMPFADFDKKAAAALAHPMQFPDPNALLLELAVNILFVTYTVAVLSYAYKALKGYDAHEAIDGSQHDMADEEVAEAA